MERVAVKRAERTVLEPHGTPSEAGIAAAELGAWGAYIALVWFLWERVLAVSEGQYGTLRITNFLWWENLGISLHFPLIVGYVFVVLTVPYIAKFAIPMLVAFSFREHFWAKSWALFITLLVSVVLITGTATVGGMAVVESERDSAVAVAQVEQQAVVLTSQIADVQHAMDERLRSPSAYVRTAASMSPAVYDRFVEARRDDWQYERLRSYRAVSEEMVALNQQMSTLRAQQAAQQVTQSVSSEVVTARSAPVAGLIGWLNAFWILLLAVVMDVGCLFLPWLAETLRQKRNRMLGSEASGWADDGHRIEDKRHEAPIDKHPYERQTVMREENPETGEVKIQITPKPHWRTVKKGRKETVEIAPDFPADEVGVAVDGGARQATSGAAEQSESASELEERDNEAVHPVGNEEPVAALHVDNEPAHPEPPTEEIPPETDEEAEAIEAELAAELVEPSERIPPEAPETEVGRRVDDAEDAVSGQQEQDAGNDHNEPSDRTPETDPRRLIAAE